MKQLVAFFLNKKGAIATYFALAIIPVLGAAGAALDYTRSSDVHTFMQQRTDSGALMVVKEGSGTSLEKNYKAKTKFEIQNKFSTTVESISIAGRWLNATDYEMTAEASLKNTFIGAVSGSQYNMIRTASIARNNTAEDKNTYRTAGNIATSILQQDANNYNAVYAYCYDSTVAGDVSARRSQMTLILDNEGGTKTGRVYDTRMPVCSPNQTLSFRLRSLDLGLLRPSRRTDPSTYVAEFYTDTIIKNGKIEFNFARGYTSLETILCNSLDECKFRKDGGIIPSGPFIEKTVVQHADSCPPGKYMYFGWEDLEKGDPTGQRYDANFFDVTYVLPCPSAEYGVQAGAKTIRLIK
jgi:hypothetical protein